MRIFFLLCWYLVTASSPWSAMATTTKTVTLHAKSAIGAKGTSVSKQGVSVLQAREQEGSNNDWNTYLEIKATKKAKIFTATFSFQYSGGDISKVQKLTVKVNSMGLPAKYQKRVFKIQRGTKWQVLANNNKAPDWKWFYQISELNSNPFDDYFSNDGTLKIKVQSNNRRDVMDLDYLAVELEISENTGDNSTQTPPVTPPTQTWKPKASDALTWQIQLQGEIDTSLSVDVYDIDLFDNSTSTIQYLKSTGRKVICYFSAGSYEGWRTDWRQYFPFIQGDHYTGTNPPFAGEMDDWDERWLDIRRVDLLEDIMTARIQLAIDKGCDAVDPDNMDAYSNGKETKINIQASEQLTYNRWIANKAHELGIAVGLKNDVGQLDELVDYFDFAVNEECFEYNECNGYSSSFVAQDKPVFGIEYKTAPSDFCPEANDMMMSFVKKNLDLKEYRIGCETYQ